MSSLRPRLIILAVVLFSLLLGTYSLFRSPRPGSPLPMVEDNTPASVVDLTFTPPVLTVPPNSEQSLTLLIDGGVNHVSGVQVELEYDPAALQVTYVTQGDFLVDSLVAPKIQNGLVSFTFVAPPDSGGITGSGTLATLDIVSGTKDTRLSFTPQTQAYVTEQVADALHTTGDAVITITPTP